MRNSAKKKGFRPKCRRLRPHGLKAKLLKANTTMRLPGIHSVESNQIGRYDTESGLHGYASDFNTEDEDADMDDDEDEFGGGGKLNMFSEFSNQMSKSVRKLMNPKASCEHSPLPIMTEISEDQVDE